MDAPEATATACARAVGASLTGVTVIETSAGVDTVPSPSVTVNVNESGPLYSTSGL